MCGIIGYLGDRNVKEVLINGLKDLEYRGYDSAGVAILSQGDFQARKAVGKITALEKKTDDMPDYTNGQDAIGIGHTRWATHGKPTELNAHPHFGEFSFVVHNGIIENYTALKNELSDKGYRFVSQTDTEVIVHLYEACFKKTQDEFKAFEALIAKLEGSFALLLISKTQPQRLFFAKNGTPLIITQKNDNGEFFLASCDSTLIGKAQSALYLDDMSYGYVDGQIHLFSDAKAIAPDFKSLPKDKLFAQKEGFRFFMEKEIYEQHQVVSDTLSNRVIDSAIVFDELTKNDLSSIKSLIIVACGTSYHAGLSAQYLFEQIAKIPTQVHIASEFRYREPILDKEALFITISQSGETADTLESLKMAKAYGLQTLSICNVDNSSMTRLSDQYILTRAGIEKGVASTKAFCTQMMTLWMLALYLGSKRETIDKERLQQETTTLLSIHKVLQVDDALHQRLQRLSKRYLHGHGFFFIGRDLFYPLALEGALKLKEISYLHAEGYPAGEMKHGPIALADAELFTIALLPKNRLFEKMKNSINELSARDSTICVISSEMIDSADDFIPTPEYSHIMEEYFYMMIVMQLLSMEVAIRLGHDVDMPRNLAKSVTVE